jgi:hypothetical protein
MACQLVAIMIVSLKRQADIALFENGQDAQVMAISVGKIRSSTIKFGGYPTSMHFDQDMDI